MARGEDYKRFHRERPQYRCKWCGHADEQHGVFYASSGITTGRQAKAIDGLLAATSTEQRESP